MRVYVCNYWAPRLREASRHRNKLELTANCIKIDFPVLPLALTAPLKAHSSTEAPYNYSPHDPPFPSSTHSHAQTPTKKHGYIEFKINQVTVLETDMCFNVIFLNKKTTMNS